MGIGVVATNHNCFITFSINYFLFLVKKKSKHYFEKNV